MMPLTVRAFSRWVRRPWLSAATLGWVVACVALGGFGRCRGWGANYLLRGPFAGLVLPLVSFTIVGACVGAIGLRKSLRPVVGLGASPAEAARAIAAVTVVAGALLGGALAMFVCRMGHRAGDSALVRDMVTSFGVGALAGAAYASYFLLGSALGASLRAPFLFVDWMLGAVPGAGCLLTPRAHVVSLFGGPLADELSSRVSSWALGAMVVTYATLAIGLSRRL